MSEKQQDDTIKSRIIGLLQKGYSRSQLINDFNFAERTVDNAIKEYKEQGGGEDDEAKKGDESDTRALAIPAKLDIKQVIAPEYLIKHPSLINGDQRQTFIDALLVYEAARRSVMEDTLIIQGLAAAQAQTTETQLKVLREAKSESREVAQAAAGGSKDIVVATIEALNKAFASEPAEVVGHLAGAVVGLAEMGGNQGTQGGIGEAFGEVAEMAEAGEQGYDTGVTEMQTGSSLACRPIVSRSGKLLRLRPMPKSWVSLIVVSVRRARPCL
jgi:hypothetical protein